MLDPGLRCVALYSIEPDAEPVLVLRSLDGPDCERPAVVLLPAANARYRDVVAAMDRIGSGREIDPGALWIARAGLHLDSPP